MPHHNQLRRTKGIALLMTMMVLSVVLAVTLAIVELSLKQLALSVDAKDSEIAFHAANAGLECVRYARRTASSSFENGANNAPFNCFGTTSPDAAKLATTSVGVRIQSGSGALHRYQKNITWNNNRCSAIDVLVMVAATSTAADLVIDGPGGTSLGTVFAGYGLSTKRCPSGGVCTLAKVSGYNSSCSSITTNGILKREVLLEF